MSEATFSRYIPDEKNLVSTWMVFSPFSIFFLSESTFTPRALKISIFASCFVADCTLISISSFAGLGRIEMIFIGIAPFINPAILLAIVFRKWVLDRVGLITHKDFAKFKADIEKENAVELERLKVELQREAKHKEIQFTELRKQQVTIFEQFYFKLATAYDDAVKLVNPIESGENDFAQRLQVCSASFLSFRQYFWTHKIYFNEAICTDTNDLLIQMLTAVRKRQSANDDKLPPMKQDEHWVKGWDLMQKDVSILKDKVEKEFRKLMDV